MDELKLRNCVQNREPASQPEPSSGFGLEMSRRNRAISKSQLKLPHIKFLVGAVDYLVRRAFSQAQLKVGNSECWVCWLGVQVSSPGKDMLCMHGTCDEIKQMDLACVLWHTRTHSPILNIGSQALFYRSTASTFSRRPRVSKSSQHPYPLNHCNVCLGGSSFGAISCHGAMT